MYASFLLSNRFLTCAAEVPMFQIAGKLQKQFGTWNVLTVTQIAFVIRFTYYANLTNPWVVLPCEVSSVCVVVLLNDA